MQEILKNKSTILFDGYCLLCEKSVKFIIKRDKHNSFLFASLQSEVGNKILKKKSIPVNFDKSVILIENDNVFFESEAALRIAKKLRGLWPILFSFIIVPKSIRDWLYKIISRNRFKWFEKKINCYVPTNAEREKFL